MTRYLLPESTVVIDGKVDLIDDTRLKGDPRAYLGTPISTVATAVRGDSSHGARELTVPKRGDNSMSIELTSDARLSSVTFNSVGVGSKVIGAGVKVVAVVAGVAARVAGGRMLLATRVEGEHKDVNTHRPTAVAARAAWEAENAPALNHQRAYADLAKTGTEKLLAARAELSITEDPIAGARAARRIQYLEDLVADSKAEIAKVEGLFEAWSSAHLERKEQHLVFTLAVDELPIHDDPTSFLPAWSGFKSSTTDAESLIRHIWETLGVLVEIGPISNQEAYRPNEEGVVRGTPDLESVHWREPRLARLWVWRVGPGEHPVLEKMSDALVTDRFSKSRSFKLEGRFFGDQAAAITMDPLGGPAKFVSGDKGRAGAIADTISAAPEQFLAGLDAVTKASTAIGDLSTSGAEIRLKAIKRQVEQRTQGLELEGLNATAGDWAELKRLKQQVEITEAQGALAPRSELAELEGQLAKETARRDIDAVQRDRAQAAQLGALHGEIDLLKAELDFIKLRDAKDDAKEQ